MERWGGDFFSSFFSPLGAQFNTLKLEDGAGVRLTDNIGRILNVRGVWGPLFIYFFRNGKQDREREGKRKECIVHFHRNHHYLHHQVVCDSFISIHRPTQLSNKYENTFLNLF